MPRPKATVIVNRAFPQLDILASVPFRRRSLLTMSNGALRVLFNSRIRAAFRNTGSSLRPVSLVLHRKVRQVWLNIDARDVQPLQQSVPRSDAPPVASPASVMPAENPAVASEEALALEQIALKASAGKLLEMVSQDSSAVHFLDLPKNLLNIDQVTASTCTPFSQEEEERLPDEDFAKPHNPELGIQHDRAALLSHTVSTTIHAAGASTHNDHAPGPPPLPIPISCSASLPAQSKLHSVSNAKPNTKKALLIGIVYYYWDGKSNSYEQQLHGPHTDVERMREFLITCCGYLPENITIMTDAAGTPDDRLPTKENIVKALDELVSDAAAGDDRFFLFSGHGKQVKNHNGKEADEMDEVILAMYYQLYDNGGIKNFIKDDYLFSVAMKLPPKCRLIALFDCCHSGTALDLPIVRAVHFDEVKDRHDGNTILSAASDSAKSASQVTPKQILRSPGFMQLPFEIATALVKSPKRDHSNSDIQPSMQSSLSSAEAPPAMIIAHTSTVHAAAKLFMRPLKRRTTFRYATLDQDLKELDGSGLICDGYPNDETKAITEPAFVGGTAYTEEPEDITEPISLGLIGEGYFNQERVVIVEKDPSELPTVMSWSACSDGKQTYEDGKGEGVLVKAFVDTLTTNPHPTILELLKNLTRTAYEVNKHRDPELWPQPQFGSLFEMSDDHVFAL